jgi:flagella basal body P-ring formation protein FlgA
MRNGFRTIVLVIACGASASPAQDAARLVVEPAPTRFVADTGRLINATVELRSEATVYGTDVLFKQVARWSDADAPSLEPLAGLQLTKLSDKTPYKSITIQQIKAMLHDAGVNEAMIRFTGSTACTVARADVKFDEGDALKHWLKSKQPGEPLPSELADAPTTTPVAAVMVVDDAPKPAIEANPVAAGSLRAKLLNDLATRLGQMPQDVQLAFNPTDDRLLNLSEPQFRFNIVARKSKSLGNVSWEVTIVSSDAGQHKAVVNAVARLWQDQVVVTSPVSMRQVLRPEDVATRRVLTEDMPNDTLLTLKQTIGQEATRDMRPGTVMTGRLVQAVPMVKAGQLVSVMLGQGAVRVKTVARAVEPGSFGQTIKVKNETTKDIYDVVVTGPQSGSVGDLPESNVASMPIGN